MAARWPAIGKVNAKPSPVTSGWLDGATMEPDAITAITSGLVSDSDLKDH